MTPERLALRRDVRTIGLVSGAHGFSHFFQLTLPPLFPLIREEFDVSYAALGLLIGLFYAASGIGQTIAGFLVDRFGAPRILLGGMALLATAIGVAGLSAASWMLVPIALLAGLGNSVFHPADYAIFNGSVDPRRLGRAYSLHGVCGNLGWALAPAVVVTLSGLWGWRGALVTVGGLGLVAVAALASQRQALADHREAASAPVTAPVGGVLGDARVLLAAPILFAFAFFAFLATAQIGLQTFSVAAMIALYEVPLGLATSALTGFLLGNASGILAGGFLADRARRQDRVAASGLLLSGAMAAVVATAAPAPALLPVVMALSGFFMGSAGPSRDLIVRAATPTGASGKVFGFVYSGLDLGSSLTPLVFGWLLDRGEPRLVFLLSAGMLVVTVVTVVQVRRRTVAAHPAPLTLSSPSRP